MQLFVLIPDLMGLFWITGSNTSTTNVDGLNPRFDGAFLNFDDEYLALEDGPPMVLIPDLMGLFWILDARCYELNAVCLNPRFDGAFLNFSAWVMHSKPMLS